MLAMELLRGFENRFHSGGDWDGFSSVDIAAFFGGLFLPGEGTKASNGNSDTGTPLINQFLKESLNNELRVFISDSGLFRYPVDELFFCQNAMISRVMPIPTVGVNFWPFQP